MHLIRTTVSAACALLAVATIAAAQGPCDLVVKQASQVLGAAVRQPERMKPAANIEICTVRSTDGAAEVSATVTGVGKGGPPLAMGKMLATAAKDPAQTVRDEQGLGKDAFSIREKDKFFLMFGDTAHEFYVRFTRDRGITDADVERVRQFAKQLLAAK